MKLGLENVSSFLDQLGRPQSRFLTVHLAGTNGKGSCAAMLAAVMQQAGYKTGLYTSPHLISLRERIRVNGKPIPRRSVVRFVDRHRPELVRRKLSFFEVLTAMAFEHFARTRVEVAVIETGLGGRLDATNVMEPRLTITTDISLDHVEILGPTLDKIAFEKAGIIKPGVPHVIGRLPAEAEVVIRQVCRERRAPLHRSNRPGCVIDAEHGWLDFRSDGLTISHLRPALEGYHQLLNASVVLSAASILREQGMCVSAAAVRQGMERTRWAGRFQILCRRRRPTVVLDVGHNEMGVRAFAAAFERHFPGRRAVVIAGFVKRKNHQQMFDALAAIADEYYLVPLATHRSTAPEELLERVDFRSVPCRCFKSLRAGLRQANQVAGADDIIVVVGSHYLVGEYLALTGKL